MRTSHRTRPAPGWPGQTGSMRRALLRRLHARIRRTAKPEFRTAIEPGLPPRFVAPQPCRGQERPPAQQTLRPASGGEPDAIGRPPRTIWRRPEPSWSIECEYAHGLLRGGRSRRSSVAEPGSCRAPCADRALGSKFVGERFGRRLNGRSSPASHGGGLPPFGRAFTPPPLALASASAASPCLGESSPALT